MPGSPAIRTWLPNQLYLSNLVPDTLHCRTNFQCNLMLAVRLRFIRRAWPIKTLCVYKYTCTHRVVVYAVWYVHYIIY